MKKRIRWKKFTPAFTDNCNDVTGSYAVVGKQVHIRLKATPKEIRVGGLPKPKKKGARKA